MIARHLSSEADSRLRGEEFGRAHGPAVHATIAAYERLFAELRGLEPVDVRELGRRVGGSLRVHHPGILAEIEGIAEGAGAAPASVLAINARTEILAGVGAPECSVVGVAPERSAGSAILAQNWDWHPDLAGSRVVWTVTRPDGHRFTTLTEAGLLAKIGLNDRGLALCLNILATSIDGGVGGMPIHVLCRLLLQDAGDLGDARAILDRARVTASSCFSLAHAGPGGCEMASCELSPAGVEVLEPDRGVLLHTNHFLAKPAGVEDRYLRDWPDTELRLRELDRRLRHGPSRLDVEAVKSSLRSHEAGPIGVCCHDRSNPDHGRRQGTLAAVCIRPDLRRIEISDGAPCSAPFELVGDV